MKVYLGVPRGFCAGVVRAVDVVHIALQRFGAPVYVKHQIVHNPFVVKSLEEKGAVTVDDVNEIPYGSTVIFSAHGSPPEDFEMARKRELNIIDATCPLVTKVHNEAKKYSDDGRRLILMGHKGHQEVKGTMGQSEMYLLDERDGHRLPAWDIDEPVTVLTQTTLSVDDTQKAIKEIRGYFSDVIVRNDLCYATTNRQIAVKKMCKDVEVLLVIGAPNSSNANRLREVAELEGIKSYLINGPNELNEAWFRHAENIGITSGASTPELLVEAVVSSLNPDEVVLIDGVDEDVNFVLPMEIR